MNERKRIGFRRALTFCVWAFALAWAATLAMRVVGPPLPPPAHYRSILDAMRFRPWFTLCAIIALLPPVVAIVLARRWPVGFRDWGLRAPGGLIVLIVPIVALAVQLMAIGLAVGSGIGRFDPTGRAQIERLIEQRDYSDAIETSYELRHRTNAGLRRVVVGLVAGLVVGAVASPIIEIAWRGLLHTELRWMGFAATSLLVGVLAATWWVPCLITAPMGGAQTMAAAVRLAAMALLGAPLAWLRETTGSIIPAAVFLTSWVVLLELPPMMVLDATNVQTALMSFAATGLLAGAALIFPPKVIDQTSDGGEESEE